MWEWKRLAGAGSQRPTSHSLEEKVASCLFRQGLDRAKRTFSSAPNKTLAQTMVRAIPVSPLFLPTALRTWRLEGDWRHFGSQESWLAALRFLPCCALKPVHPGLRQELTVRAGNRMPLFPALGFLLWGHGDFGASWSHISAKSLFL